MGDMGVGEEEEDRLALGEAGDAETEAGNVAEEVSFGCMEEEPTSSSIAASLVGAAAASAKSVAI